MIRTTQQKIADMRNFFVVYIGLYQLKKVDYRPLLNCDGKKGAFSTPIGLFSHPACPESAPGLIFTVFSQNKEAILPRPDKNLVQTANAVSGLSDPLSSASSKRINQISILPLILIYMKSLKFLEMRG